MKMTKMMALAGAVLLTFFAQAQDRGRDVKPADGGRDAAARPAGDRPKPKAGAEAETSSKDLAGAYARVLFLNEKEFNRVYETFMAAEQDLITARQKLAMAQREIDETLKKQLNVVDQTFTEEQRTKLRMARSTGAWDSYTDPRGCKDSGKGAAKPVQARPTGDAPSRPTDGSRISPERTREGGR